MDKTGDEVRLYAETECEHGRVYAHEEWDHRQRLTEVCPGGVRREVVIDYHGAATRLGEVKNDADGYAAAVAIVNQALGVEETNQ